ncbi:transferase family-domain-containing protein [Hypoxylon fragiforme]|uniref:transferase family-domain-containing protein n=1 Tax=Hypoxylon fragiforme TaxID=63214 RepID=UPI0020C5C58A|nr:transferase family-domain-containing protein [Hypoxylon fragiforme]KAI2603528.1 transferase family-domain-containing protein [Hypoxylon fragiforme]
MPSEYASQVPAAIPLEKAGPKAYIRYVFPIELPKDYDLEECFKIYRDGFEAAKKRIPALGCEGVPDPDAKQAGVLKLQKYTDYESITYKDLRKTFPYSWDEMKAKRFPVSCFTSDMCRRFTWPSPGDRLPVVDFQANFVPGGVLMGVACFHVFGDAKSYFTWFETWAEECRRIQGLVTTVNEIPDELFTDREKAMKPSGRNPGRREDHPELLVLPFTPDAPPPKMVSLAHVGQAFYFSPENIAKLKADTAPKNATEPAGVEYVSTNDAVSALMWRSVMNAQNPVDTLEGDPVSVFNIAVDGRTRTNPPVHPRTLGNWLGWVVQQMPIRKMLTTANLADMAALIRKSILKLDNEFVDDLNAMFEDVEDVNRVVAAAFVDVPGYNIFQTSWVNFNVYDLDFGTKLGGIKATRCPDIGVVNGGSAVLPALPNGGIEMIIGVEDKCLPRLLADPILKKYTEAVTW